MKELISELSLVVDHAYCKCDHSKSITLKFAALLYCFSVINGLTSLYSARSESTTKQVANFLHEKYGYPEEAVSVLYKIFRHPLTHTGQVNLKYKGKWVGFCIAHALEDDQHMKIERQDNRFILSVGLRNFVNDSRSVVDEIKKNIHLDLSLRHKIEYSLKKNPPIMHHPFVPSHK